MLCSSFQYHDAHFASRAFRYGGGPKLPRYVASVGGGRNDLRIELHPLMLSLIKHEGTLGMTAAAVSVAMPREAVVKDLRFRLGSECYSAPHNVCLIYIMC